MLYCLFDSSKLKRRKTRRVRLYHKGFVVVQQKLYFCGFDMETVDIEKKRICGGIYLGGRGISRTYASLSKIKRKFLKYDEDF